MLARPGSDGHEFDRRVRLVLGNHLLVGKRPAAARQPRYRSADMDRAEAIQVLGRLHTAQGTFYAGGDEAPVRALLTDDVHWHVPGRNAIAGDHRGVDAVLAYFRRRRDLAGRTFRIHSGDVLVGDGARIAALTDGTAIIGGVERRWSTVGLYEIRDIRVAACWLLPLDADSFDEIWADPSR
jgi:ketosteroid isomerase-like protein